MKKHKEFNEDRFLKDLKRFTLEDLFYMSLEAQTGVPQVFKILTPEMIDTIETIMEDLNKLYPHRIKGTTFSADTSYDAQERHMELMRNRK